jgi:hypothetical protein
MRSEGDKAENRELGVAEQPGCKVLAGRSPGCELGYRGVGTYLAILDEHRLGRPVHRRLRVRRG